MTYDLNRLAHTYTHTDGLTDTETATPVAIGEILQICLIKCRSE